MAFRRTLARLNRVYRLSERHISPGYEHKVKDVMDNIKREVINQPGLISIEVLTEKHKPDCYYALTCWEFHASLVPDVGGAIKISIFLFGRLESISLQFL